MPVDDFFLYLYRTLLDSPIYVTSCRAFRKKACRQDSVLDTKVSEIYKFHRDQKTEEKEEIIELLLTENHAGRRVGE
jgi:hypothetical protein